MVRLRIPIRPGDPSFGYREETDAEMLARSNAQVARMQFSEEQRGDRTRLRWEQMHRDRTPIPDTDEFWD